MQLAKAEGIYVYGYDYPVNAAHAQNIGVDRFITTEERFEDVVKDVDAVLDLVVES